MLAALDRPLTAVFCTADDLLSEGKKNARRRLTDAEVVTLCEGGPADHGDGHDPPREGAVRSACGSWSGSTAPGQ